MWLLEAIFVDPLTARFAAFYLPFLAILIVLAFFFSRPSVFKPGEPRASRGGIASFGSAVLDHVASLKITPNQVSYIGLGLVFANCALFLAHRNTFWFGTGLALSYLFDALDGVVARRQGTASRYGGYLDAVGDRYQELATFFVLAWVEHWWAITFLAASGSMLTSYNKARVALEISTDNKGWPDLLSRHRRLWLLCFGLIGDTSIPWLLSFCMVSLAFMTHFTALQRFLRARWMLLSADDRAQLTPLKKFGVLQSRSRSGSA